MNKKIFKTLLMIVLVCFTICAVNVNVMAASILDHVKVTTFDPKVDYSRLMDECLKDGSKYALEMGRIYEAQRNLKIKKLGMNYKISTFFADYNTKEEIEYAMLVANRGYTDEDLYWLSRCVNAEMGCNWMPDWVQRDTASVVINNANSLGTSIKGAVFSGKYGCVDNGMIYRTPTSKVIANCKYVLEHGTTLPSYVIGQSGEPWGPVVKTYYDPILGTTTYFWRL